MQNWPLLSVVTFLPLVGAAFILFARGEDEAAARYARWAALWTTIITFLVSLLILKNFVSGQAGYQLVEDHPRYSHHTLDADLYCGQLVCQNPCA
jgi:NADH-quinone oxidoreductase subunit M